MRAVIVSQPGSAEVLTLADVPTPKPKAEELLVKVHAAGMNRADISQRRGTYPPPPGASEILGLEIAGEIVSCGTAVKNWQPGHKVFGLVDGGGYAEYCTIDQEMAMPIPDGWSYTEAAAIPEVFLTAQVCLFQLGELKKNQSVLIHAGGSGVGTAAIQMAHAIGAKIYITAGSAEKVQHALALGTTAGINYKTQDFVIEIKRLTNDVGVDLIIDSVGGDYLQRNLRCLKTEGCLIQIAKMGGASCEISLGLVIMKRLQIKGNSMRSRPLAEKRKITEVFQQQWLPLLRSKKIKPIIDSIFPFTEVQEAHRYMENNKNFGKVILSW